MLNALRLYGRTQNEEWATPEKEDEMDQNLLAMLTLTHTKQAYAAYVGGDITHEAYKDRKSVV